MSRTQSGGSGTEEENVTRDNLSFLNVPDVAARRSRTTTDESSVMSSISKRYSAYSEGEDDMDEDGNYSDCDTEVMEQVLTASDGSTGGATMTAGNGMNKRPEFDLCASLHKRRGGLRRNAENNWVSRCFTLYGSVLCYYESPDPAKADPSRPRGRIDLSKEETLADMHSTHKAGAPSNHLITVNIYVLGGKRKWEMCCMDRGQQEQWYNALKVYDGKPVVDVGVLPSSSPSPIQRRKDRFVTGSVSGGSPSSPSITYRKAVNRSMNRAGNVPAAPTPSTESNLGQTIDFLEHIFTSDLFISVSVLNVCAYVFRYASFEIFCIAVVAANFTLLYQYRKSTRRNSGGVLINNYANKQVKFPMSTQDQIMLPTTEEEPTPFFDIIPAASTISRAAMPKSPSSSSSADESQCCSLTPAAMQTFADQSTAYDTTASHSYWNVTAPTFSLRIGPNYKRNKCKAPSDEALFDLFAVDLIKSPSVLKHIEDGFDIPSLFADNSAFADKYKTGHAHIPPMLVINCSIPSEEPSFMNSSVDGPSIIAVVYLVISQKTLEALKDLENASPAVKLFSEWCKRAENDDEFRGRFKAMCVIDDIETLGLPSMISNYNGKPVLINRSGNFTRYPNYIEMSINVHMFSYIAKKCLFSLQKKFPSFVFNMGFTIEGREDDELPEVLLGGSRMMRVDFNKISAIGGSGAEN